ncbi:MAG: CBS domain-containing protein, partial [Nocardioidaceae bacterium]
QDVDRTRVLTAEAVMEQPVAVLGAEQGPRTAHKLIRQNQLSALFVVDRDHKLRGVVYPDPVAKAVEAGRENLTDLLVDAASVPAATFVADLFMSSASADAPLAVVDDQQRLVGVIPQVTLLNALGSIGPEEAHTQTSELMDTDGEQPDQALEEDAR